MARFSPAWHLNTAVAAALVLAGGIGAVIVTGRLVQDDAALAAYREAARCPAAPTVAAECRWSRQFTVTEIRHFKRRNQQNGVVLVAADGSRWETSYAADGPVFDHLSDGDRVTGTIWRGMVTEIAAVGATQETMNAPADLRKRYQVGAMILVPGLPLAVVAGGWWLVLLARRGRSTAGLHATLGLAPGLIVCGMFSPALAGESGDDPMTVVLIWAPMAVIATIVARVYVAYKRPGEGDEDAGTTPTVAGTGTAAS